MELSRTPVLTRTTGSAGLTTDWFEQYLPAPEAAKRIKALRRNRQTKKGRSVFLKVDQRAHTDKETYFPIMGSVEVGAAKAIKFINDSYKNFTDRGALVRLSWCDTCLFVG